MNYKNITLFVLYASIFAIGFAIWTSILMAWPIHVAAISGLVAGVLYAYGMMMFRRMFNKK